MTQVIVASGTGYSSLQAATKAIVNEYNADVTGTEYEMTVQVSGANFAVNAAVSSANRYLSSSGVKPWAMNAQVAANLGNGTVLFQWLR